MTKKKKTFRKFINEQVLGVKQKEKQFDKFEDFVKDVKGIKPPENKAASFQEFINEARGYEFDNDSVDKFDKMVIESKIEREQQKLEERKTRIEPNPIVLTNEQIEEMNRRRIIEEINEVLKHRVPVLVKMSFQQWLNIPHNKFVFELDEYQAKRLYEQDMSRVEKYEELKKKSGKGRNRVAQATSEETAPLPDPIIPAIWGKPATAHAYDDEFENTQIHQHYSGVNWALASNGTTVQSNSIYSGVYPASKAIDGDTSIAGGFFHSAQGTNEWLQIDFGQNRNIDKVVIWNRDANPSGNRLDGYRLEFYTGSYGSGSVVHTISESPGSTLWKKNISILTASVNCRSIRLVNEDATQPQYLHIQEFQAFESGVGEPTHKSGELDAAWTVVGPSSTPRITDTINPYDGGWSPANLPRYNVNTTHRPSFLMLQGNNTSVVVSKPITLATNMLCYVRFSFHSDRNIADNEVLGELRFGQKNPSNDTIVDFNNHARLLFVHTSTTRLRAQYNVNISGSQNFVANTNDIDSKGQAIEYAAIHKVGTTYHGWVGTESNWIYLGSHTANFNSDGRVGLLNSSAESEKIVGFDFVRFIETDKFPF